MQTFRLGKWWLFSALVAALLTIRPMQASAIDFASGTAVVQTTITGLNGKQYWLVKTFETSQGQLVRHLGTQVIELPTASAVSSAAETAAAEATATVTAAEGTATVITVKLVIVAAVIGVIATLVIDAGMNGGVPIFMDPVMYENPSDPGPNVDHVTSPCVYAEAAAAGSPDILDAACKYDLRNASIGSRGKTCGSSDLNTTEELICKSYIATCASNTMESCVKAGVIGGSPAEIQIVDLTWCNGEHTGAGGAPSKKFCMEMPGCTDPDANNYNSSANTDDGSCDFNVYGCTDPNAINYDPNATADNGACMVYANYGCTDSSAMNYNSAANIDDGSCTYGVMLVSAVYGCTDSTATNYNSAANIDDGSCNHWTMVLGCTNPSAANYNMMANYDDGTCVEPRYGCMTPGAMNYDPLATVDNGACMWLMP